LDNQERLLTRLRKALRVGGNTHELEDVLFGLETGKMQAFWNDGAIVVTEIVQAPARRYLHVFLSAGEKDSVLALDEKLKAFAKDKGCEFGRAFVRPGFEKALQAKGWKRKMIVMEYE
jgi:hypothetical protein